MSNFTIKYQIKTSADDVDKLARKIAIEQSVETPESLISTAIEEQYLGKSELIHDYGNTYTLGLTYHDEVLSQQFNQLLNLSFGNVAMYPNVRLVDIELSDSCLQNFSGPQFGIEKIRNLLNVHDRPLLATALKPRGYTDEQFAQLTYEFALGGGDIVKDDQNLMGDFDQFKSRVKACNRALNKAVEKSGNKCFYFPFVSAPFEELDKYFDWLKEQGIEGVLLAPSVLGLDAARGWAAKYNLIYMAHPTFTGSYCVPPDHGMDYRLFYGLLFRLAGVDISVYPNTGGRFEFSEVDCKSIANELRKPMSCLARAFPCPAGGMQYEHLSTMCQWYGKDAVFLLGGSLLEYSDSISESTKAFQEKIIQAIRCDTNNDRTPEVNSSCEYYTFADQQLCEYLKFDHYNWQGRESIEYKKSYDIPFKDIRRVELVGKQGEQANFDLRYFEIEPDGYSSKEQHRHTHVIIVVRGCGEIIINDNRYRAKENDILYIKPHAKHQLVNNSNQPFGFYCIVDHDRDQPTTM